MDPARRRALPNSVRVLFQGTLVGASLWVALLLGMQALTGAGHRGPLTESLGFALFAGLAGGAISAAVDARGGELERRLRARIRLHPVRYAEAGAREVVWYGFGTRTSGSRTDLVVTDQLLVSFAYRSFLGIRVHLGPTAIRLRGPDGAEGDERVETWQPTEEGVALTLPARVFALGRTVTIRSANPNGLRVAMGEPELQVDARRG